MLSKALCWFSCTPTLSSTFNVKRANCVFLSIIELAVQRGRIKVVPSASVWVTKGRDIHVCVAFQHTYCYYINAALLLAVVSHYFLCLYHLFLTVSSFLNFPLLLPRKLYLLLRSKPSLSLLPTTSLGATELKFLSACPELSCTWAYRFVGRLVIHFLLSFT